MNLKRLFAVVFALAFAFLIGSATLKAQTTISQGSIQGTITDPAGAVVPGAVVSITNRATGQVSTTTTTSAGTYNSGGLLPGDYVVSVVATGFKTVQLPVTVQIGTTASGSIKLELGASTETVEVQSSAVTVNTEQATVQGVLTAEQIDKLPINGRNFLDVAQLEPGVQMQDGQTFDPTKAGYSSVSINGVYGRTPRIELDGVDITDETVGTTTANIPLSSIEEFAIERSSLDLSTELTSAGAVNISTRSGTNTLHGMAYYGFRDSSVGFAAFPGGQDLPFQRNQYGGRVGGAIIKDKLFFFVDGERTKQDGLAPVVLPFFTGINGGYTSPFRDDDLVGKMDWQASKDVHVFYRFSYNKNASAATYYPGYAVYSNKDNDPGQAVGVDINKGTWSHTIRFGYFKFHNEIVNGAGGLPSNLNPVPSVGIEVADVGAFFGPNLLAPQGTFQSDKQLKYDGSKILGSHIIRFGAGMNRIEGGGFAAFFGTAPLAVTTTGNCPGTSSVGACDLLEAILGNGQGFFTEKPGFNLPAGGQSDWRTSAYVGDSWKVKPNFTLTYGLRYNRDTGRTDTDLAPIPCSAAPEAVNCTGNLFDQWQPGFGNRVRQPDSNFGPQLGFAWVPKSDNKLVIRGGAGIYYENSIFNNTLFDRPAKLAQGLFSAQGILGCGSTAPGSVSFQYTPTSAPVTSINGADLATQVCGQPLSVAGPYVAALQTAFQQAVAQAGPAGNPNFVGSTLSLTSQETGLAAFAPNTRTTRSYQMNIGGQRELWKGAVFSADYIRNVSVHFPLTIDVNHVGAARFLNVAAATNAINATLAACGVGSINAAIAACPGLHSTGGATINDFASNGLDSGYALYGGLPVQVATGGTPDTGAAFPGQNPNMGVGDFEEYIGRSVYNGLQTSYKQDIAHPFEGVRSMNLQVAYTLSRFEGNGGNDQNFSAIAWDNDNPTRYFGPTSLDRTNQFKWGWTVDVAHRGPEFSVIGAFSSAPPTTIQMEAQTGTAYPTTGEIFRTDFTGDGTVEDLFPGFSGPGQYGRAISPGGLTTAITNYNATQAGTPTPAGLALVGAGLFTTQQLYQLGGVKPYVQVPGPGQIGNAMFREVSMILAWPINITERFSITPSISAFNVFNFSNFNPETGFLNNQTIPYSGAPGDAVAAPGSVNGTNSFASRDSLRVGTGSGVFSQASPREMEFGLKLNF